MEAGRPTSFATILVATDFSNTGDAALDQALLLASERDATNLHVVYVAGSAGENVEVMTADGSLITTADKAVKELEARVEKARVTAMKHGEPIESERVTVHIRAGIPEDEILRLADELGVDLIVLGTHGRRGLRSLVLGSVAESVLRSAKCAVLVVRPKHYPPAEAGA
ncbi:MAG: universal stress protein [Polyangiaceae bacterium]|nr:universal stress protein [Polyangiaceae bacterium]